MKHWSPTKTVALPAPLNGIPSSELTILNLQPDAIAASWSQNRIDAAFIWSPVLDELKKDGQVIVSSGELAKLGKPTFDGIIVQKKFAAEHQEFMEQFVSVLASADQDYREAGQNWNADSTEIQAIATLSGASPEINPEILKQYHFPSLEEQTSKNWLGGDVGEGAAHALYNTSVFLKNQGKIEAVQESSHPLSTTVLLRSPKIF